MLSFQADFVPSDTKHPALASTALQQLYNACWHSAAGWDVFSGAVEKKQETSTLPHLQQFPSLPLTEFGKSAGSLAKERGNLPWNSTPTAKHSHIQAQRWAEPA